MKRSFFFVVVALSCCSMSAEAYIGPGLGTGAIATVLGVLFGFVLLLIGVVWYPVKFLINKIRKKN